MINKKLIYLFAGYISGNIIASLYGSKSGTQIRKQMEDAKKTGDMEDKKILLDYLVDMHKKIFSNISTEIDSSQVNKIVGQKLQEAKDFFSASGSELTDILKQYKGIDGKNIDELGRKIQDFFALKFHSVFSGNDTKSPISDQKKTKIRASVAKKIPRVAPAKKVIKKISPK